MNCAVLPSCAVVVGDALSTVPPSAPQAEPTPALTNTCGKCDVEKAESRAGGPAPRPRITLRTQIESLVAIEAANCGLTGSHVLPAPGKDTPGGRGRLKPPSRCQGASIPAVPCPLTSPPSRCLSPLVHLQDRFRVVSYSSSHETSDLRPYALKRRAQTP